ncbi:hypothetical protein GUJ93_ZPchr0013g34898 [Zizania palustris]|uniref:Uncharacterized protein n=1 Tax=Zizania palustris TaxID=103762 RepID=A0A8J5X1R7_ZIZPA|nr:hypothetical protein GUJ93_ZPchr0013g34898 [Zizania palustris]
MIKKSNDDKLSIITGKCYDPAVALGDTGLQADLNKILGISSVPVLGGFCHTPGTLFSLASISAEVVCKPCKSYCKKCNSLKLIVPASLRLEPNTEYFRLS